MKRLKGKVAIITGAAQGMGASHAKRFIEEGAKVVISDIDIEKGEKFADDLGENALFVKHDVTKEEDWKNVVSQTEKEFGPVNILINNAGTSDSTPFETSTVELYTKVFKINQLSVFLGMQAVYPSMQQTENGSIVNISSMSGIVGQVGAAAYNGTKFAVRGMTKTAALELAPLGIRVNSVHPGIIKTPLTELPEHQEILKEMEKEIPLGRVGEAKEITNLCLYLASDESTYSTGSEFVADGGYTAQ